MIRDEIVSRIDNLVVNFDFVVEKEIVRDIKNCPSELKYELFNYLVSSYYKSYYVLEEFILDGLDKRSLSDKLGRMRNHFKEVSGLGDNIVDKLFYDNGLVEENFLFSSLDTNPLLASINYLDSKAIKKRNDRECYESFLLEEMSRLEKYKEKFVDEGHKDVYYNAVNQIIDSAVLIWANRCSSDVNEKDLLNRVSNIVDREICLDHFKNRAEYIKFRNKYIVTFYNELVRRLGIQRKSEKRSSVSRKKIEKKESRPKLRKEVLLKIGKWSSFAVGFGSGLVFSSFPGTSTVMMTISAVKLGFSLCVRGSQFLKDHSDNRRIAKILKFKEKHFKINNPEIAEAVDYFRGIIKKFDSSAFNYVVNGFTFGYFVGNIIEICTGKTFLEHVSPKEDFSDNVDRVKKVLAKDSNKDSVKSLVDSDSVNSVVNSELVKNTSSNFSLNTGDVVDISSIKEGLVSYDATDTVSLYTDIAHHAVVDKILTGPDGETVYGFLSDNGGYYGYIKESVLKKVLTRI